MPSWEGVRTGGNKNRRVDLSDLVTNGEKQIGVVYTGTDLLSAGLNQLVQDFDRLNSAFAFLMLAASHRAVISKTKLVVLNSGSRLGKTCEFI